jgi:predicted AlkP superfamily phosphohydrolase/phosphomutase
MTSKTVLIGLDGATFTVLDSFMERGIMPFLRDFVASGVRAPLRSVVPPLTPPAWTSLMTGKRPGRHGVFDFFQKESPESRYFRFSVSGDIQTDTIWSLTSQNGQKVTALNFPLMFPPPPVNGCVLPGGWMPWRQLRLGCHPPGLFDRLKALPSFNARELALDMAFEEKALEGCASEEYADWIGLHTRRERRWFDILKYLMQTEPAELTAILFDGVDKLQHLCWRFIDPALQTEVTTAWEQQTRDLCEGYFRQLDTLLAEIVELAGPEATIVMASDHGFGPTSDIFFLNAWLEREGFLTWASGPATPPADSLHVGIGQITRHVHELDWTRTIAYAATPSSQGIHIVRQAPGSDFGVPPESYDAIRNEIADGLRRFRHPDTGRPVFAEIWTREEAFAGPYEEMSPDLTVILENNAVVSILRSDTPLKCRPEPVGSHHPEGVLMARGPELRTGVTLPALAIMDVAPLVLHSLGVPVPDDLDGRLPVEAFEPGALLERPLRTFTAEPSGKNSPTPMPEIAPVAYDAEDEAVVLQRLRALGYIE